MEILFWASVFVIAYVYVGYPVLLAAWARLASRPVRKAGFAAGSWPSISIVLAAQRRGADSPSSAYSSTQKAFHLLPNLSTLARGAAGSGR